MDEGFNRFQDALPSVTTGGKVPRARRPKVGPVFGMVFLMTALPLAGCLAGSGPSGSAAGGPVEDPGWEMGDWWRYRIQGTLPAPWMENWFHWTDEVGHRPKLPIDTTATMVAYPESVHFGYVRVWGIATDSPRAFYASDAFDLPLPGAHWDLAYGDRWNMTVWNWPLVDGKTWSTEFSNTTLDMTAERLDNAGRFEVRGQLQDGSTVLRYRYDPEVRWYTDLQILDRNGSTTVSVDLLDRGSGFDGSAYTQGGEVSGTCLGSGGPTGIGECGVGHRAAEKGQTWFYYDLVVESPGHGKFTGARQGPNDVVHEVRFEETCPCEFHRTWFVQPDQGPGIYEWLIDHAFTGQWKMAFTSANPCFHVLTFEQGNLTEWEECSY